MPLSEFLHLIAEGKLDSSLYNQEPSCSSALPFQPENDVAELVWENGQVLSSRLRKIEASNDLQPQSTKGRGRGEACGTVFKFGGKYGPMEPVLHQGPMHPEIDLDQDDDVVPWLNYPIEDDQQHDYCSELSGVTVTENSSHKNLASSYRVGGSDRYVEMQYGERAEQERFCSAGDSVMSSAGPSHYQMIPAYFPSFRSRVASSSSHDLQLAATSIHPCVSEDPNRSSTSSSRGSFPAMKSQGQAPSISQHALNSPYVSRPLAFDKAKPDGIGVRIVPTSSSIETIAASSPGSIPCTSNRAKFSLIDSCSGNKSASHPTNPCKQIPVSSEEKPAKENVPQELPGCVIPDDGCNKICVGRGAKGSENGAKNVEPVHASSVGSGNTTGRASDDAVQNKRKHRDSEECEGHSEDADEESAGAKRRTSTRGGTSAKRSRAAEVHNLSERKRRDRINEKMRALQELIPNCNKVDKASMLDEAIDYLKTLQLQVQIMSMGSGLYMPSMVLPPGMSQMHAAHMARFSNVGVGMGMGYGFGIGLPEVNGGASSIPGPHFLSSPMPGPSPLNGFGYGIPCQGVPMPYPHMPISRGPVMNTAMGTPAHGLQCPSNCQNIAPPLVPREAIPSINLQVIQQNGANNSANPTSSKCQEMKECHQQSALLGSEHQAVRVADDQASKLANVNGHG